MKWLKRKPDEPSRDWENGLEAIADQKVVRDRRVFARIKKVWRSGSASRDYLTVDVSGEKSSIQEAPFSQLARYLPHSDILCAKMVDLAIVVARSLSLKQNRHELSHPRLENASTPARTTALPVSASFLTFLRMRCPVTLAVPADASAS